MRRRTAFTLVELVVVILILGILAGVAAPKMLNTSEAASESSLRHTLTVVRDAIELYAAQNGGAMPPCTAPGTNFKSALQPYIRGTFPTCPMGAGNVQSANVTPGTAASGTGTGWMFNTATGAFFTSYNGLSSDGTTTYDQF